MPRGWTTTSLPFLGERLYFLLKGGRLVRVSFGALEEWRRFPEAPQGVREGLAREMEAYLSGRKPYPDWPYLFEGLSPFAERVLFVLREIPRGQVRTYGWLAARVGRPRAARAVGQALRKNPLPLFFPCHRVVGRRDLGGFSAGLSWKIRLLSLEGSFDGRLSQI
ncbi:MGMT family protein [Thermosulfurimonas marina]|uniref:MGMT family protein n=1 Tax=Thermosulfurimonas marina TaxID=2047767 RepID=A0A6H1WQQ8_9BACT|nr:MGMT family protein [Thermosulfurimonas marina]QJA05532.1 MGMT family protein [Thermosulfurimonas marina]